MISLASGSCQLDSPRSFEGVSIGRLLPSDWPVGMSVGPVLVDWYGRAHTPPPEVGSATSGQIVLVQIRKMSQGKQACMQCCSMVWASAPGCIPALPSFSDALV